MSKLHTYASTQDGDQKLPETTGNRQDKFCRLLQYVMVEARATKSDSEDSTEWRSMTPAEIANHVKAVGSKRKTATSQAVGRTGEEVHNDSVGDAGCQEACAEEEEIRTAAFLTDDSQKELEFPDDSLKSPPAHTQTLREQGGSLMAPASLDTVARPHRVARLGLSDTAEEGSRVSERSRGKQSTNP